MKYKGTYPEVERKQFEARFELWGEQHCEIDRPKVKKFSDFLLTLLQIF
jgi:hypothetical protein